MAAKMPLNPQEATAVSRREEFSDFALVLEDGQELKCHRTRLAEASPVFRMILKQDGEEARTNKMKMTEFAPATVESFLDFIYADSKHIPSLNVYKKIFNDKRLTPELLRMAHMYEVTITRDSCFDLLNNIKDSNVIEIWSAAETLGHGELKKKALDYLKKKEKKMMEVPGFKDTFQSPQMMESLIPLLVGGSTAEEEFITVTVLYREYASHPYKLVSIETISVKLSVTVETLMGMTDAALVRSGKKDFETLTKSFKVGKMLYDEWKLDRTLESLGVNSNMGVVVFAKKYERV